MQKQDYSIYEKEAREYRLKNGKRAQAAWLLSALSFIIISRVFQPFENKAPKLAIKIDRWMGKLMMQMSGKNE